MYGQVSDVTAAWLQMKEVLIIHLVHDERRERGQIERWRRLFKTGPYLEVTYKEMVGYEGTEVAELPKGLECKLYRFLDLDPSPLVNA